MTDAQKLTILNEIVEQVFGKKYYADKQYVLFDDQNNSCDSSSFYSDVVNAKKRQERFTGKKYSIEPAVYVYEINEKYSSCSMNRLVAIYFGNSVSDAIKKAEAALKELTPKQIKNVVEQKGHLF